MNAGISIKTSFFLFLGGLICAAGMAFLLNLFLAGPRLGKHYDFLVKYQSPPPVSREILIIETAEFIEGGDILSVLVTLTEMKAANLIVTGRAVSTAAPIAASEAEIRRRFMDEYVLLGSNVRNLFEGIRTGSVSPQQSPVYVERLVELAEQGRDRLLMALVDRDEDLLRSIAAFGNYFEVYTKPVLDKDGALRRVQPIDTESSMEHPVFRSLKHRYAVSQIETIEAGQILWLRGHDDKDTDIFLDSNGNIITSWNCDFRNIDIELFREYETAGQSMRYALEKADKLGAFSSTMPENSPLFLDDYAFILREEMLKSPNDETRTAWRAARANYLKSLDEFLNGSAETVLVKGYDEVIADEVSSGTRGANALEKMRDELIEIFVVMREEYGKLSDIYTELNAELEGSFCVMGSDVNAQYSALLANAVITGAHVKPVHHLYTLFWSISGVFIVLMVIFLLRPFIQLITGVFLSILAAAAFCFVFVYFSYWLDPLIVLVASVFGTLVVFSGKCAIINYRSRRLRTAYGTAVSQKVLRNIIRNGRQRLSEVKVMSAAVIAIRDVNLFGRENREKPREAGRGRKTFFTSVKKIAFDAGAVIAGFEGDTVLVCFGSPLDKTANPAYRAYEFVKELLHNEKITWRFGVDFGECSFSWMQETGFFVNGRPAVHARILASRTSRLQKRALMTNAVREQINIEAKKIDALNNGNESVFELV